jgi:hypothetical protein
MLTRNITEEEIRFVIENGETIEDYDNDTPYPSKLIFGKYHNRTLHIVAAINDKESEIIVITVYQPDIQFWEDNLKTRRKK